MSTVDDFLANPPLFLRSNHVLFKGGGPGPAGGGVYDFYLIAVTGRSARYHSSTFLGLGVGKADAGVFEIRYAGASNLPAVSAADRFQAVWSGFEAGGRSQCDLGGAGADLMLTYQLTGCAIAWSARPDGSARFSHYNLKDAANKRTLDGAGMAAAADQDYAGAGRFGVLAKERYYARAKHNRAMMHANVIGWRNSGKWEFWIQYVENKRGVQQIRGVEKLNAGSRVG